MNSPMHKLIESLLNEDIDVAEKTAFSLIQDKIHHLMEEEDEEKVGNWRGAGRKKGTKVGKYRKIPKIPKDKWNDRKYIENHIRTHFDQAQIEGKGGNRRYFYNRPEYKILKQLFTNDTSSVSDQELYYFFKTLADYQTSDEYHRKATTHFNTWGLQQGDADYVVGLVDKLYKSVSWENQNGKLPYHETKYLRRLLPNYVKQWCQIMVVPGNPLSQQKRDEYADEDARENEKYKAAAAKRKGTKPRVNYKELTAQQTGPDDESVTVFANTMVNGEKEIKPIGTFKNIEAARKKFPNKRIKWAPWMADNRTVDNRGWEKDRNEFNKRAKRNAEFRDKRYDLGDDNG